MYDARSLGIRVVREVGSEQHCLCPVHADHSPSASFNRLKGILYCYVCGRAWNLQQLEEVLGERGAWVEDALPELDLLEESASFDLGEDRFHPYFEERRVHLHVLKKYGVRWKEGEPQAAVLPIRNVGDHLQGVAYRYLSGPTRYKVFGKTTPVWPMPLLKEYREGGVVVVVEGAWSAMRIATVLFGGRLRVYPVALLGAKASERVVATLSPFKTVFLYDHDDAGDRACRKMREIWPTSPSWSLATSPDDMEDEEILRLFKKLERMGAV